MTSIRERASQTLADSQQDTDSRLSVEQIKASFEDEVKVELDEDIQCADDYEKRLGSEEQGDGTRSNEKVSIENKRVFLGGTMGSDWRSKIKSQLQCDVFDPEAEAWGDGEGMEATQQIEEENKKNADKRAFVVTPKQRGLFTIAEMTASAVEEPEKTAVAFVDEEDEHWDDEQIKSNDAIKQMLKDRGTAVFDSLEDLSAHLNQPDELIDWDKVEDLREDD